MTFSQDARNAEDAAALALHAAWRKQPVATVVWSKAARLLEVRFLKASPTQWIDETLNQRKVRPPESLDGGFHVIEGIEDVENEALLTTLTLSQADSIWRDANSPQRQLAERLLGPHISSLVETVLKGNDSEGGILLTGGQTDELVAIWSEFVFGVAAKA